MIKSKKDNNEITTFVKNVFKNPESYDRNSCSVVNVVIR
jgi:hypothetical protein